MLKIENLTKKFGDQLALHNLSLTANKPGLYLLIGANGSGKSTLFNVITGLMTSFDGTITLNKKTNPDERRALAGIATEPFYTEPHLTVQEIIDISIMVKRAKPSESKQWISFWKLNTVLEKPFKALSTGMKKRLSLVISLIGNPTYLFWDEPFNGLDPLGIELLNTLIVDLIKQEKYLFLSTHLLNELQGLQASCLVIKEGLLVQQIPNSTLNTSIRESILQLLKTAQ